MPIVQKAETMLDSGIELAAAFATVLYSISARKLLRDKQRTCTSIGSASNTSNKPALRKCQHNG